MQCALQQLSIQNQMLINVYMPKKLNHHRRINKIQITTTIRCDLLHNQSPSIAITEIDHNCHEIKDWAATFWVTKKAGTIERAGISPIWAQIHYSDGYLRRKTEKSATQSFSKRSAYWVPDIYLRNQMGTGSTYVENYQGLRKMLRWKNLKGQKNETYESHSFYLALT